MKTNLPNTVHIVAKRSVYKYKIILEDEKKKDGRRKKGKWPFLQDVKEKFDFDVPCPFKSFRKRR